MKFRSRLIINLQNLAFNYKAIKELAPNNEILFMVKADAYGHGVVPVTRYAITDLGIREFGCATLAEAVKLREELSDLEFEIYVFSDTQLDYKNNSEIYLNRRIIPVISNLLDLDFILHHQLKAEFKNFPLCLKFNTGMNRLGINPEDAITVSRKLKSHGRDSLYHLISHFANASSPMNSCEKNKIQQQNFNKIKKDFLDFGILLEKCSESNSGAIEQKFGFSSDGNSHIRPGLMMYGQSSLSHLHSDLGYFKGKLVSSLETYIIRTFKVDRGECVGYDSFPCPTEGIIAILAIGYGDGFSTRYTGAHLYHKGFKGKIIGKVNMDMIQVLFPLEAKDALIAHDVFTIWGGETLESEIHFQNFINETKSIPYEIFCSLLPRIPRVYRLE